MSQDLIPLGGNVLPNRPIALVANRKDITRRRLGIALAVSLSLPALYFGFLAYDDVALKRGLRAHGVATAVLSSAGECTTLRNRITNERKPSGCDLHISYRLRPEHGSTLSTASVWLTGSAPLYALPLAVYDPASPARVMLEPELSRGPELRYVIPAVAFALLAALAAGGLAVQSSLGLAAAARNPDPVLVRVVKMARLRGFDEIDLYVRQPGKKRDRLQTLKGREPFLVQLADAPGLLWAVGLKDAHGRVHLLDRELRGLVLTAEEFAVAVRVIASKTQSVSSAIRRP